MCTAAMYPTKVVLTNGQRVPRATLLVSIDLGLGFSALPPEMQRQAIERAMSDALVLAEAKLTTDESEGEDAWHRQPVGSAA